MKISIKALISGAKIAAVATLGMMAAPQSASAQSYYIGQLVPGGYNFCPRGSLAADGQILAISSNTALFSLIGTIYGGDGRTSMQLPDLRGRAPLHAGNGPGLTSRPLGQKGGSETVTMTTATMPSHNHLVGARNKRGDKRGPGTDFPAPSSVTEQSLYSEGPADVTMDPAMIQNTGSGLPMQIMNPFLAIQWCIVTEGVYPSRS